MSPGTRWRSQVCSTEVIVVRGADVVLHCGGQPMVELGRPVDDALVPDPAWSDGTLLGKRYSDEDGRLEVLVTKPGQGSLHVPEGRLEVRQAKSLPSSD